jgi:hypothetical protein
MIRIRVCRDGETLEEVAEALRQVGEFYGSIIGQGVNVYTFGSISDDPDWVVDVDVLED